LFFTLNIFRLFTFQCQTKKMVYRTYTTLFTGVGFTTKPVLIVVVGWSRTFPQFFSHTRSLSLFFFCWSFYNITIQLQYPSTYYRNFLHHFWKRGVGCGVSFTRFVLIYFLKTRNALISTHTTRREKLAYLSHITHF
jgi:hypothetical protein